MEINFNLSNLSKSVLYNLPNAKLLNSFQVPQSPALPAKWWAARDSWRAPSRQARTHTVFGSERFCDFVNFVKFRNFLTKSGVKKQISTATQK